MVEEVIDKHLQEIEAAGKHLRDITNVSIPKQSRQVRELSYRHIPTTALNELVAFPLLLINGRGRNSAFFGRSAELEKIQTALDHKENNTLQTYTIYGRRGIGKTDIALEYVYNNPSKFDASFWIQCETSITIRQSFNDMAEILCLPGADRHRKFKCL